MDDNIETSPPHSPKKARRRSSFFEKRQSIAVAPLLEPVVVESNEEELWKRRLDNYIESLSSEKVAWKKYYSEKKNECNGSLKSLKSGSVDEITLDTLHGLLRKEETDFLKDKPDFNQIWKECGEACVKAQDLLMMVPRLYDGGSRYEKHLTTHLLDQHRSFKSDISF